MKARTTSGPLLSRRFHLVLLHLAEEARRDLDSLAEHPGRTIHSLRTRMKNLRAILQLVKARAPKPERKAVQDLAGALKDAFSEQRDSDVLATLRMKFSGGRAAAAQAAAPVDTARNRKAKADASRLIRLVSDLTLHGLEWDEVIRAYVRSFREGRRALNACERKSTSAAFHRLRRPVKELFYQSQALQPLDGMKARRNAAERLGDRLGERNDLHMLHAEAKKSGTSGLMKKIAKKKRALEPAIFKAAAKLFHERPSSIAAVLERCVKFQPTIVARAVRQA